MFGFKLANVVVYLMQLLLLLFASTAMFLGPNALSTTFFTHGWCGLVSIGHVFLFLWD